MTMTPCGHDHARKASPSLSRRRRLIGRLAGILLLASGPSLAAPYTPSNDSDIVADLPAASSPEARQAQALHKLLLGAPNQLDLALKTAATDIDLARAESDPRYGGYAEAALAPWWSMEDPPFQVLLLRATIKQNRHDFDGALADLARVIADQPNNGQAYLTRAVVRQVRGEFAAAAEDCRTLAQLTSGLPARACIDSVNSLSGQAEASFRDLQAAYAVEGPEGGKGVAAWSLTLLAEMAERLGRPALAETYFRQAFGLGHKDGYLLGAYADFLLDQHRPAEVVSLLAGQVRIDPLLLRLALAEQQLDSPALAGHVADLVQRFAVARARGDRVHQREEARFTLFLMKQPVEALRLARANWQVQREPADIIILLEAASAANPAAANPVIAWLQGTHLEDVAVESLVLQLKAGRS